MRRWNVMACAVALLALAGCQEDAPKPETPEGEVAKEAKGAEKKEGDEEKAGEPKAEEKAEKKAGEPVAEPKKAEPAIKPPEGFVPSEVCAGVLEASKVLPVPVMGAVPRHGEAVPGLGFRFKSGRLEVRDSRVALRLASEPLKDCSPFLRDGGLAKKPRLSAVFSSLKTGSYVFPDREAREFKYWNYIYTTDAGSPFTVNAMSGADSGLVVLEAVDTKKMVASGSVLLCVGKGERGWVSGRFEVPICDKRKDKAAPLMGADKEPEKAP